MVTARLAIGSVSILALGALAIGSAPFWLHRGAGGSTATPWGAIASLDVNRAEAAQPDDRAKLLELAALKSGISPEPSTSTAPAVSNPPTPAATAATAVAQPAMTAVADATAPQPSADSQPATSAQQVASVEVPDTAAASTPEAKVDAEDRININTASSSALDHIPGAGRIGRAIVSHRPYRSVKDLVSRRILRMSDFEKIQSRISVE